MTARNMQNRNRKTSAAEPRVPLPASVPRPEKRVSGRTGTPRTPAHVRVLGVEIDDEARTMFRRKLGMRLAKFATSIERVTVRLTDANGPRGGVDHVCSVKVVLSGLPSVVVERRDTTPRAAFDRALDATVRAVGGTVARRRTKRRGL